VAQPPIDPRRDRASSPLDGGLRGTGLVVALGAVVLLVCLAVVALLRWALA
jgi:hypothetical protein